VAKHLVLDANILIRAVLGTRAVQHISGYALAVIFLTIEEAFEDAATYLPEVLSRRGLDEMETQAAFQKLESLRHILHVIPNEVFAHLEPEARERLKGRDEDDWPYLALALLFDCPLWTEDRDFFGCGIPLWTTDRVEIYLKS
jgi:predicted nucleic acid-binding protein